MVVVFVMFKSDHCCEVLYYLILFTPTGPGGGGCGSGTSDQQEEPSQSGASFWLGGSVPCRHAKGE